MRHIRTLQHDPIADTQQASSNNKPVKNRDLWEQLIAAAEKPAKLEWVWTKDHAGSPLNEEADRRAKSEAEKLRARLARSS